MTYFRFILRTEYEPRTQDGWREVKAGLLKIQSLKLGAECRMEAVEERLINSALSLF